jgi:NADH dehydrogenase FAD-containing subunit
VRRRVLRQLKKRQITVLREACVGIAAGALRLGSGATLACDVPILAIGTHAPPWLQGSGLALSDSGHLLVNAFQQSTSHPQVFAAGDVATRADQPHPKSGVYAVRAGPPLAHNLLAAHAGQPLQPHHPPRRTLNLLSCGAGHAIGSYGPLNWEGAWVWRWKDRIDRGFMATYTLPAA